MHNTNWIYPHYIRVQAILKFSTSWFKFNTVTVHPQAGMILLVPVTMPVTSQWLSASHCGRRCHDSSFTVTVTAQFHSDSQWSSSQSELAVNRSPGPACTPAAAAVATGRCSAWPLSAGGLGRQGLARCWVAAAWGPRHGRQQFLKQDSEFSWKHWHSSLPGSALLSMRSSLAAAAGSGSASEEAVARLLAAAERLGLEAASPRRPSSAASSRRRQTRRDNFKFNSSWSWTHTGSTARRRGAEAAQPPCRR